MEQHALACSKNSELAGEIVQERSVITEYDTRCGNRGEHREAPLVFVQTTDQAMMEACTSHMVPVGGGDLMDV